MQPSVESCGRVPEGARTLGDHVIRVVKLLHAGRHRAPRPHPDVDPMTYPLLFRIAHDSCRVSDLAAAFHSEISTVSRQVSGLVDLGLIERRPDPRDGRAHVLALTTDGAHLLGEIRRVRDTFFDELLAGWSDADRTAFADLLGRFGDALEASSLGPGASTTTLEEHR